ncbi:MAG: hypothetical protein JNM72_17690 [Deltaproteobacteria bacterium]|nr:hypothetical protein [Deltaproteobacteria bacterium]
MALLRDAWHDLRRNLGMPVGAFAAIGMSVGLSADLLLSVIDALLGIVRTQTMPDLPRMGLHLIGAVGTGLFGYLRVSRAWARLWHPRRAADLHTGDPAQPARWVVMSASLGPNELAETILAHHRRHGRLERLFVLHTEDEPGRAALARVQALCTAGPACEGVGLPPRAVDDPDPIFDRVEGLYTRARAEGLGEDDVVLDYTGGTKAFTAALVLCGAPVGRRLQALMPRRRTANGYPDREAGSDCVEVDLRFDVHNHLADEGAR